jgi:ElaB/YqjD/DUF883 family membrane-anchored ribosome-binding protein
MAKRADEINPGDPYEIRPMDTRPPITAGPDSADSAETDDTAVIRADIEQTRAEMSETIEAIQERLSPANLKEQAQEQFQEVRDQVREQVREQFEETKQMVRDATIGRVENMIDNAGNRIKETRHGIMDTIRENPIPAALVGIGLGWMFMNGRSQPAPMRYSGRGSIRGEQVYYEGQRRYSGTPVNYEGQYRATGSAPYYDDRRGYGGEIAERGQHAAGEAYNRISETAQDAADRARDTADRARETAGEYVDRAQERVSEWADQAQYQAHRLEDRFQRTLQDNPLAIGAVALAVGAAVGLAIPQTERENELMGETRDNLIERAQSAASETLEKVQRVAEETTEEVKHTVKEQAREQGLTSS